VSDVLPATSSAVLSVAEAQAIVARHVQPLPPEPMALGAVVLGRVLAADVASDLDMPPYDKSMMDGYAIRRADLPSGRGTLQVIEEITAGRQPRRGLAAGQASRIMTGAPIPPGCDAVVVVERTRSTDDGRVEINDKAPYPGQNILPRAAEMRSGDRVLSAGTVLGPKEFGVLATVGQTTVVVHPAPRVAVLSTGDELVEPCQRPEGSQIRNSNGAMLTALVSEAGGVPRYLGIGRDDVACLRPLVCDGLKAQVLLLSGGVSAGKLDLVPGVLQEAGVTARLHKVEMKPGKPAFFGTRDRDGRRTLVFGLPGNPVSALVCFALFVRPALRRLAGRGDAGADPVAATLAEDFTYRTDRPTYHPAHLEAVEGRYVVRAVPWFGSADLRGLARANALLVLPAGDHQHRAGGTFPVVPL
jgi:molybdopterin molybdotransferase